METFKAKYREVTWRWRYKKHRSKENISQIIRVFTIDRAKTQESSEKNETTTFKSPRQQKCVSISLLHTWITLKSSWNSPKLYGCDDVARLISGKQDVVTIWAKNWKHRE